MRDLFHRRHLKYHLGSGSSFLLVVWGPQIIQQKIFLQTSSKLGFSVFWSRDPKRTRRKTWRSMYNQRINCASWTHREVCKSLPRRGQHSTSHMAWLYDSGFPWPCDLLMVLFSNQFLRFFPDISRYWHLWVPWWNGKQSIWDQRSYQWSNRRCMCLRPSRSSKVSGLTRFLWNATGNYLSWVGEWGSWPVCRFVLNAHL